MFFCSAAQVQLAAAASMTVLGVAAAGVGLAGLGGPSALLSPTSALALCVVCAAAGAPKLLPEESCLVILPLVSACSLACLRLLRGACMLSPVRAIADVFGVDIGACTGSALTAWQSTNRHSSSAATALGLAQGMLTRLRLLHESLARYLRSLGVHHQGSVGYEVLHAARRRGSTHVNAAAAGKCRGGAAA